MGSTDGMRSDYDDHSEYQRRVAAAGTDWIDRCVDGLPLPDPPQPVVIMDLGAATGRNSLAVVSHAVQRVRERSPGAPVVCIHNDLVTNDWSKLFENVATASDSYLASDDDLPVLPMASAGSFFEPTVPPHLAHLQLSFAAAHWYRNPPVVPSAGTDRGHPVGFYACEAEGADRAALAAQAADDWSAFLGARAQDLVSGGHLLVQTIGTGIGADGDELVTARETVAALTAVGVSMADDGLLDRRVVDDYIFPVYMRTAAEASAPFAGELSGAFELLDVRVESVANPYLDRWRADGDTARYAADYAAFVRGFAESALRGGLVEPAADGGDPVDGLVDELFSRLEQRFAERPEVDAFRDWTLTVVARRR